MAQRLLPDHDQDHRGAGHPGAAKLRGTTETFASRLLGTGVTTTNALGVAGDRRVVRGLSVRDVEATLADALGAEAALSKSTVSRVCEQVKEGFARWRERRLDDLALD
jgi:putative transposase